MKKLTIAEKLALTVTTATVGLAVTNVNAAQAQITNGGFETGDFTGWSTLGDTSIQTSGFGSGPTEGFFQALGTTNSGAVSVDTIESALGLSSGTLAAVSTGNPTEGSVIYQTFSTVGGVLSLDFNFLTSEATPTSFNDFAFVSLAGVNSVADTNSVFQVSPTLFNEETGFGTFSTNIAAGTYTLGIGVLDVNDFIVGSGVLVDNVNVDPVPEPLTILGAGAALSFGGFFKRKLAKNNKKG